MDPNLLDIGVVLLFSFLGVLISTRLRLPSVIGVLFFGMLIGPHALGLIQENELISLFFEMGAILLLFFIGIEFNIEKISRFWLRASFVTAVKFAIVFLFTYLLSAFFGLPLLEAVLMGIILSFSSTAIFARIISGTPQQGREEAQLMSAVLVIEDIFAVFILTLIPQVGMQESISLGTLALPLLTSLAILFLFYVGLKRAVLLISEWMDEGNSEPQLFLALSLCSALAFLAASFGLSPSIGAFFAGSAVSGIAVFKRIEGTLQQLFILFSAFFFFAIGMQVDPSFIAGSLALICIFGLVNLALKFFSVSISTYLAGFGSREAFFSALIMLTVSEFALLISAEAASVSSFDFVSFSPMKPRSIPGTTQGLAAAWQ
jgi:CPA2 family monovalent cation:H+ antiporter-2